MKRGFSIGLLTGWIQLTRHKFMEWQLDFGRSVAPNSFLFSAKWTTREDHAGFYFAFSFFHLFMYELSIGDHRHWDYDADEWCGDGNGVCAIMSENDDWQG